MNRILAIDSGLSVTKAVVFDAQGRQLGVARRAIRQIIPDPHRVERDMGDLWAQTASAIRDALDQSGTDPSDIAVVAATAHGDGLYLLDQKAQPLGHGILSLDSRAAGIVAEWEANGIARQSLPLTGQVPHASAPSALLAWIQRHEPARFAQIGHVIACKDWLRFCLTGSIGTDRTEASTSFTDVATQDYSDAALSLFGLTALSDALPDIAHSASVVGHVTPAAADVTGLKPGTPVAAGLHDVTASALGIGAHRAGVVGVVAGTYSINECLSTTPRTNADWFCRNAVEPGVWNNMSISPASTTNYDWFIDCFCAAERDAALARGQSIHALLAPEIDAGLARASSLLYHPFLFGSPFGATASAGLFGMRGWHDRGDVLAALLEGIAFNHRHHVDALRSTFPAPEVRLTGGVSRNGRVVQMFADVLGLPVTVTETDESAAWGAALCAGAAVGLFDRFDADPRDMARLSTTHAPHPGRAAHYERRFAAWRDLCGTMGPAWPDLTALERTGPRDGDG